MKTVMNKKPMIGTALAVLSILSFGMHSLPAFADGNAGEQVSCSVAYCNLDAEVAKLRTMSGMSRFELMKQLRKAYAKSNDAAALKNVAAFAKAAAAYSKELNEDEWMVNEALALASECILQLAKLSDIAADQLFNYFQQLPGSGSRFEMTNYWRKRIPSIEDRNQMVELLQFFGKAEKFSRAAGDEEWQWKDAKSAQEELTHRLLSMYPYFEGSYAISARCQGLIEGADVPRLCKDGMIDRMVIMDLGGWSGLKIFLVNSRSGLVIYSFDHVVMSDGGTTFEAIAENAGTLSQIKVIYSHQSKNVSGWVQTTDGLLTLEIAGRLETTPASVFDQQVRTADADPIPAELLSRVFTGKFNDQDAILTIRRFEGDRLSATMVFPNFTGVRIAFQSVTLYPKRGILVLLGSQPNGSVLKVTLALATDSKSITSMTGMAYSSLNGGTYDVRF